MKREKIERFVSAMLMVSFGAGFLLLVPVAGRAIEPCQVPPAALCDPTLPDYATGDCDSDGLTNLEECEGFLTAGSTRRPINGYNGGASDRLDPSQADLFYMVTDMNGSPLQPTSLMYQAMNGPEGNALSVYSGGLPIRTHRIEFADVGPDRLITSTAKAAWIRESDSLTAEGTYLGSTPESTPASIFVYSTIYTKKIKNNVDANCPPGKNCYVKGTNPQVNNVNGTNNAPIIHYYILEVTSHEMGHGSLLAPTSASSYYHYRRSGTVMDPQASFSKGVYTIPTAYDPASDPPAVTLK